MCLQVGCSHISTFVLIVEICAVLDEGGAATQDYVNLNDEKSLVSRTPKSWRILFSKRPKEWRKKRYRQCMGRSVSVVLTKK